MKKHKVLMLGWEYPPFINGGLGIACAGLCEALSQFSEITLIVPKILQRQPNKNIQIIGLNRLNEEYIEETIVEHESHDSHEVYKIDVQLNPYHVEQNEVVEKIPSHKITAKIETRQKFGLEEKIDFENLYGNDVIQKVIYYSELIKKISSHFDFELIHAHDWMTFLAGVELKKMTEKPLILHVHSLDYDRAGSDSRGWIYDMERSALHQADLIMPVSNYTGSILTSHYGISKNKIKTIHNGIGNSIQSFRKEKTFPEKMVLFIGRLTGQKGPEYFLDIATKIYRKFKNVRFVIAGTGEKLTHLLEDGAYRQIGNRVHFTGFIDREKINELLSMADVYCMPSVSEPFGLTALEAAQFGVPTVISERSGVAEVLSGSLKADFWDIDLMVEHILKLLSDNKTREKVIHQNNKALEKLTWLNAAKSVAEAYEMILNK